MSERKKILGPIEWLALLAGLGILLYLGLKKGGIHVVERSVEVEFVDPDKTSRPQPPRRGRSESAARVEQMLQDMAREFNQNETGSPPAPKVLSDWNLSQEEASFYQKIRERYELDRGIKTTKDWFQLLRASHRTYRRVNDLFAELSPRQSNQSSPDEVLSNEAAATDFYERIEDWYDLSRHDLEPFVRQGKHTIEDWALFLSQNQNAQK